MKRIIEFTDRGAYTRCRVGMCDNLMFVTNPRNYKTFRLACDGCEALCGNDVKLSHLACKMIAHARSRGKYDVELETAQILALWPIDNKCPVFGTEFKKSKGIHSDRATSPSLDRIDNTKGYTPDNIQIISNRANSMKQDASLVELKLFAQWVDKL